MQVRILHHPLVRTLLHEFIEIRFPILQIVVSNADGDLQLLIVKI
jgi:hypothetical protein